MSTFFGLDIARKALSVSQKGIEVTGHNIANADTVGYSRQRLTTVSVQPASASGRFVSAGREQAGGGVMILSIDQIRSPFLDRQYRNENMRTSEWSIRSDHLNYVEGLFDELSGTGLSDALNRFAVSMNELSKNPVNKEFRTNLLQTASNLADTFGHFASQLAEKQMEQDGEIVVTAGQINDIADSIVDLNLQIAKYELSGQKANDLRDRRNLMLDNLSSLTAYTLDHTAEGSIQVRIGGELLVDHDTARYLSAPQTVDNPIDGVPASLHALTWEDSGEPVGITGGSLKALIDLRDGDTSDRIGMPYLCAQLDLLARGIAESINAVHSTGWTFPADANGNVSNTGNPFFATSDGSSVFTASNFAVDPRIVQDVYQIATSLVEIADGTQSGNNGNVLRMMDLFDSRNIPGIGSYNGFLDSLAGEIAVETAHSKNRLSGQEALLESLGLQRQSISAVSIDEEATQLIRYQHSYAAAARLITAIDEALDILVNKTGIVGR